LNFEPEQIQKAKSVIEGLEPEFREKLQRYSGRVFSILGYPRLSKETPEKAAIKQEAL